MSSKTALFTIARMNPPHHGHLKLIKTLMDEALKLSETDVYIILSHTKDFKKNPLECNRKRQLLQVNGMIQSIKDEYPSLNGIMVNIICGDDDLTQECGKSFILKQLCYINQKTSTEIFKLIIGQDRGGQYNWIEKSLLKMNPRIKIHFMKPLDRPDGEISSSFIRSLVTSEQRDEFISKYFIGDDKRNILSKPDAEGLYDELYKELVTNYNINEEEIKEEKAKKIREKTKTTARTKTKTTARTKTKAKTKTIARAKSQFNNNSNRSSVARSLQLNNSPKFGNGNGNGNNKSRKKIYKKHK